MRTTAETRVRCEAKQGALPAAWRADFHPHVSWHPHGSLPRDAEKKRERGQSRSSQRRSRALARGRIRVSSELHPWLATRVRSRALRTRSALVSSPTRRVAVTCPFRGRLARGRRRFRPPPPSPQPVVLACAARRRRHPLQVGTRSWARSPNCVAACLRNARPRQPASFFCSSRTLASPSTITWFIK